MRDAFGLTVSEETETICMSAPYIPTVVIQMEVTGQRYIQPQYFICLDGVIIDCPDVSTKLPRSQARAGCVSGGTRWELYHRPNMRLGLKIRVAKGEIIETVLYRSVTRTTRQGHCRQLESSAAHYRGQTR